MSLISISLFRLGEIVPMILAICKLLRTNCQFIVAPYKQRLPELPQASAPGPPTPRNIPPRDRTTMEVLLEYMVA